VSWEIVSQGLNTVPQPGLNGRIGFQPHGRTLGGSSSTNAMADVLPYFIKVWWPNWWTMVAN